MPLEQFHSRMRWLGVDGTRGFGGTRGDMDDVDSKVDLHSPYRCLFSELSISTIGETFFSYKIQNRGMK